MDEERERERENGWMDEYNIDLKNPSDQERKLRGH